MPGPRFSQAFGLDAALTGLVGTGLTLGAGPLADVLGLPTALLRWAGLSLLAFAILVAYVAQQKPPKVGVAWVVVVYNVLWALASVVLLVLPGLEPTPLGAAFVLFQAGVVAVFAFLQYQQLTSPPASRSD